MNNSHVFTIAGLGQAPFKVIGYNEFSTGCAYCGRGIKKVCVVKSADDNRYSKWLAAVRFISEPPIEYNSSDEAWAHDMYVDGCTSLEAAVEMTTVKKLEAHK